MKKFISDNNIQVKVIGVSGMMKENIESFLPEEHR